MEHRTTQAKVDEYRILNPLLESLYKEVKTFALKKQDGMLSKLKATAINQVLIRAKSLLENERFSEFLQILDIDTLPSNSDAVMVMAHFKTAMDAYYKKYRTSDRYGKTSWVVEETEVEDDEDEDED